MNKTISLAIFLPMAFHHSASCIRIALSIEGARSGQNGSTPRCMPGSGLQQLRVSWTFTKSICKQFAFSEALGSWLGWPEGMVWGCPNLNRSTEGFVAIHVMVRKVVRSSVWVAALNFSHLA